MTASIILVEKCARNNISYPALVLLLLVIAAAPKLAHSQTQPQQNAASVNANSGSQQLAKDPIQAKLEKDKLELEVEKLRIENANAERSLRSIRGWLNLLYTNVPVLLAIVLGFAGLIRYLRERQEELRKREDERFEEVVKGLGSEEPQARVSAAVLLPTFLRKDYERFYLQVFNLAAGNLRAYADASTEQSSSDWAEARGLTPLTRALSGVFRESYPKARDSLKEETGLRHDLRIGRYLNASGVHLDGSFLGGADLRDAWLMQATFRGAVLRGADLTNAILEGSNCRTGVLTEATLRGANLKDADFSDANLDNVILSEASAEGAKFVRATLTAITMDGGLVGGADFAKAKLGRATFRRVDFTSAAGKSANIESAETLKDAVFEDVKGLTPKQIELCTKMGATFQPEES